MMLVDVDSINILRAYNPDLSAASVAVFLVVCDHEGMTVGEVEERSGLPRHSGRRAFRQLIGHDHRGETVPALVQLFKQETNARYKRVYLTSHGELVRKNIQASVKNALTAPLYECTA